MYIITSHRSIFSFFSLQLIDWVQKTFFSRHSSLLLGDVAIFSKEENPQEKIFINSYCFQLLSFCSVALKWSSHLVGFHELKLKMKFHRDSRSKTNIKDSINMFSTDTIWLFRNFFENYGSFFKKILTFTKFQLTSSDFSGIFLKIMARFSNKFLLLRNFNWHHLTFQEFFWKL